MFKRNKILVLVLAIVFMFIANVASAQSLEWDSGAGWKIDATGYVNFLFLVGFFPGDGDGTAFDENAPGFYGLAMAPKTDACFDIEMYADGQVGEAEGMGIYASLYLELGYGDYFSGAYIYPLGFGAYFDDFLGTGMTLELGSESNYLAIYSTGRTDYNGYYYMYGDTWASFVRLSMPLGESGALSFTFGPLEYVGASGNRPFEQGTGSGFHMRWSVGTTSWYHQYMLGINAVYTAVPKMLTFWVDAYYLFNNTIDWDSDAMFGAENTAATANSWDWKWGESVNIPLNYVDRQYQLSWQKAGVLNFDLLAKFDMEGIVTVRFILAMEAGLSLHYTKTAIGLKVSSTKAVPGLTANLHFSLQMRGASESNFDNRYFLGTETEFIAMPLMINANYVLDLGAMNIVPKFLIVGDLAGIVFYTNSATLSNDNNRLWGFEIGMDLKLGPNKAITIPFSILITNSARGSSNGKGYAYGPGGYLYYIVNENSSRNLYAKIYFEFGIKTAF